MITNLRMDLFEALTSYHIITNFLESAGLCAGWRWLGHGGGHWFAVDLQRPVIATEYKMDWYRVYSVCSQQTW